MSTPQEEAFENLRQLTECRCQPAWTGRGVHEAHCVSDYREDVDLLGAQFLRNN